MTIHTVPTFAADLALTISNDADKLRMAQGRGATLAALEQALAAVKRIRSSGSDMQIMLRQQINAAKAREAAEERARRTMRATPICPADHDLAVPVMPI